MSSTDANTNKIARFPSKGQNSSADSTDLQHVGNLNSTSRPYFPDPNFLTNYGNQLQIGVHHNMRNMHGFASKETSRSPIPIDPETYINMNKALPTRMYASSNNLAPSNDGMSQNHERSMSMSSNNTGDASQYRQVKTFIMSP